jgi:hypothetical protein
MYMEIKHLPQGGEYVYWMAEGEKIPCSVFEQIDDITKCRRRA